MRPRNVEPNAPQASPGHRLPQIGVLVAEIALIAEIPSAAALVLEALQIPRDSFTNIFAMGRMAGCRRRSTLTSDRPTTVSARRALEDQIGHRLFDQAAVGPGGLEDPLFQAAGGSRSRQAAATCSSSSSMPAMSAPP